MLTSTPTPQAAPAYKAIKQQLCLKLGRQWRVGDRLPPVKQLARVLDAGQSNTHRAVRELVREGLLVSRQRSGTFVARMPAMADAPAESDSPVVDLRGRSVMVLQMEPAADNFVRVMADAFLDAMAATGIQVIRAPIPLQATTGVAIPANIDSAVAFNPPLHWGVNCANRDLLFVMVSTAGQVNIEMTTRYDIVTVDENHGGSLAGRALRAAGCANPCYVGRRMEQMPDRFDATSAARLYGFEAGWGESLAGNQLIYADGYNYLAGGRAFRRFAELPQRPDGVFIASDDIALGFIAAAAAAGAAPGYDFKLIGFDGQDRGRRLGESVLSSVSVPAEQMGRRAARLLIERFLEPDRPVHRLQLECSLQSDTTSRPHSQENPS